MNRIEKYFKSLRLKKKKAFGVFLTAGYPNLNLSKKILKNLPDLGVDFIEIGIPFSDPMADGPLIQESSEEALKKGMNIEKCFDLVSEIRLREKNKPLILMGYYNPIFSYGNKKFIKKAVHLGVDGVIIVDLPIEEDNEFFYDARKNNLHVIRLVTPTTNLSRLKKILKKAQGFIYYVAVTGITGTKSAKSLDVSKRIKLIKSLTNLPVIIGFGIKTPDQAMQMSTISDGIVIGSSIVEVIKNSKSFKDVYNNCLSFIKKMMTKF
tara:strand:+ start:1393 stop:2187 length:795 start_codon:yes stop_codon:yes gene_type:complete